MSWRKRREPDRSGVRTNKVFTERDAAIRAGALSALVDAAREIDIPPGVVLSGTALTVDALGVRRARVSWEQLSTALLNVERRGVSASGFEELGERMAGYPHLFVGRIGRFFVRPEHLIAVGLKWIGPAIFPVFDHQLVVDGRSLRLQLSLPASFRGCAPYFHVCTGTIRAVPTVIGHPPALVKAVVSSHEGSYQIEVAAHTSRVRWFGQMMRALSSAPAVISTLAELEDELRVSFEAVVQSRRELQAVVDALPDAVFMHRGGEIVYANRVLPEMLGYESAAALRGQHWLDLVHPDDRGRIRARRRGNAEVRFTTRDGEVAYLELSPARSSTYEGEPVELIAARDVSKRRSIDRQLAVADRMASLSSLAAGLAHEINNPLTLVMSNLQLATRSSESGDGSRCAEYVRAAEEGAERVRDVVRELRAFARPAAEDQPALVDLGEIVQSTAALARGKIKPRAELELYLDPVPGIMGARSRLGQVVLNLLINALHALPERRRADNWIRVRLHQHGDQVVLEVQDNGAGIPEEIQGRIFEPFFTTKGAGEGTGLGLAVAHGIVTGYGGRISFVTERGRGTTFRVILPAATAAEQASPTVESPPAPVAELAAVAAGPVSRGRLRQLPRVLLIDDERALLDVVSATLQDLGCEVVTATSGYEALRLLAQDDRFDVIVCDVLMANGSGVELYDRLAEQNPELLCRIVFMTGGTFERETGEFLERLENDCLSKPFGVDELRAAISRAAQGRAALH